MTTAIDGMYTNFECQCEREKIKNIDDPAGTRMVWNVAPRMWIYSLHSKGTPQVKPDMLDLLLSAIEPLTVKGAGGGCLWDAPVADE